MKSDEMRGKASKLKGQLKQAVGVAIGNPRLERAGAAERAGGAVKEGLAKARRKFGEAVDGLAEDIKNPRGRKS